MSVDPAARGPSSLHRVLLDGSAVGTIPDRPGDPRPRPERCDARQPRRRLLERGPLQSVRTACWRMGRADDTRRGAPGRRIRVSLPSFLFSTVPALEPMLRWRVFVLFGSDSGQRECSVKLAREAQESGCGAGWGSGSHRLAPILRDWRRVDVADSKLAFQASLRARASPATGNGRHARVWPARRSGLSFFLRNPDI
jgi:hypothetical protein